MRTLPLDISIVLFLYGTFHNALWLEPLKWNLLIEILILLILHERFVRIWKSRNCSVTAPISIYSPRNTCGRIACPSQSPELPEINYSKFKYTVPISSQMCGKYYCSLNTLTLFMSSLLLSFVCHLLFPSLIARHVSPLRFCSVDRKWEEHVLGGRRVGKQRWEETMFAWKESAREVVLKIL